MALDVCTVLYIWGRFPTITCARMGCPRACRFDLIWFVLDRIGHQLDDHQPEERHGFRRGKRNEKQFLHANAFLDKALDVGIPVWVVILCFWPCPLASTLDKLVWTRHLRTLGLDDFEIKLWAIWRGRPIDRSKHKIQHYRRRAARICFEPSSLLCRVTICHAYWRLKVGDFFWFWFVGWHSASHWCTICKWHPAFWTVSHGSTETVGQLGGRVVGSGSSVECDKNCYLTKPKATALNNHDWSWNNIEGSAR